MALFGLNWEESKWPGHFCYIVLYFFASKIGVKLPPEKKVPWHWRWAALGRGSNCHFLQKNAFFGQKKAFFQKVHFIQKCSVTQNTVFQYVKNIFLLSQKKLVFFTILNLPISLHLLIVTLSLHSLFTVLLYLLCTPSFSSLVRRQPPIWLHPFYTLSELHIKVRLSCSLML